MTTKVHTKWEWAGVGIYMTTTCQRCTLHSALSEIVSLGLLSGLYSPTSLAISKYDWRLSNCAKCEKTYNFYTNVSCFIAFNVTNQQLYFEVTVVKGRFFSENKFSQAKSLITILSGFSRKKKDISKTSNAHELPTSYLLSVLSQSGRVNRRVSRDVLSCNLRQRIRISCVYFSFDVCAGIL